MEEFIRREKEGEILRWLDEKEIIAIRGPRQSGKTTLLFRLMKILEKKRINKKRIHFITLEDDFEKDKFEKDPNAYIKYYVADDKERHFFLIDEVQYVKKAGKILKLVYDSFHNIKIIITGSSTLDINEIGSYLVGRVILFELYPFSFEEFLSAKDVKANEYYKKNKFSIELNDTPKTLFIDTLNNYLKEYLTYGGYPRVVLETDKEKKKTLLKNIFLTYIEKDIAKIYGTKYNQKIGDLVKYLAATNGSIINYNDICNTTGLYYTELKEILTILENTYVIKRILPFHKNLITEIKKNPKIYFVDLGLRNFIYGRFDHSDDELGKLLENFVMNNFMEKSLNYWRTTAKAEVDFILEKEIPIEVKIKPKITRSLRSFINEYKPKKAILVNMNITNKVTIEKTKIFMIPAAFLS